MTASASVLVPPDTEVARAAPILHESALLEVRDLRVRFQSAGKPREVVSGVSLSIQAGEVLAMVGESGSGKSVSALAIMGLLPQFAAADASTLRFGEHDLRRLTPETMRRLRGNEIGMIFQDPMSALNPVLTIEDQITEPLRIHQHMKPQQARERALELLGLVGIAEAESRLRQYPHEFSGGMRQRVMIAIALACGPKLLIADEPTTALDVTIQAQILELLKDLTQRLGIALLIITHNLGIVARYADRVLVMYAGQVVEEGAASTLFQTPRHMYTTGLMRCVPHLQGDPNARLAEISGLPPDMAQLPPGCRFAPRCPAAIHACQQPPELHTTDVGSVSRCIRSHELAANGLGWGSSAAAQPAIQSEPTEAPLLDLRHLSRSFRVRQGVLGEVRAVHAVQDVSLCLKPGETLGVVGESGCGKSTLARMVLRLDRPSAGNIMFEGQDITHLGHRQLQSVRRRMQVVFQDPSASLNPRKTLGEIVAEPMRVHKLVRNADEARAKVGSLLEQVGLRASLQDRYSHQISGGQRQRVGIARALAVEPSFIVCDEAVSALDVSVQAQVVNLLGDLQRQRQLAYLFIAHDLAVVRHISTRVVVMYLGRVVEEGARDALYNEPLHPYTRLLLDAVPTTDPNYEKQRRKVSLQGEMPSPFAPPSGCAFRTRCPMATAECAGEVPELREIRPGHRVACIRV